MSPHDARIVYADVSAQVRTPLREPALMILTVRLFGLELLHFEVSTDPPDEGGTLSTERIDAGPTDQLMGFTNGRGDDE